MRNSPAIEIDGPSTRFGSVQAVSEVSFKVDAGRVTGFLGPDGADAGDLLDLIARNALVAALLGAFGVGVGVGALMRNQVVAVVGLLVLGFAVDPALAALVPEVGRFSPFSALPIGITDVPPEDAGLPEDVDVLSPGLAVLPMLAWIGAAFAAGAALLIRRDLDPGRG